jgi:hypothetical protein
MHILGAVHAQVKHHATFATYCALFVRLLFARGIADFTRVICTSSQRVANVCRCDAINVLWISVFTSANIACMKWRVHHKVGHTIIRQLGTDSCLK